MRYPTAVLSFITGPVRTELSPEGRVILTHLQKYSRFGFMLTWPFCFHFWIFWKLQDRRPYVITDKLIADVEMRWVPGTEQGIYFRTPGWRWDAELGMKWTWGYFPSGHWD